MRVWIAEKPSLAKAILEGLGGNLKDCQRKGFYLFRDEYVTWAVGHLMEIAPPADQWKLELLPLKAEYPPVMQPISQVEEQFNIVKDLLAKSKSCVHAGDNDQEGQLLIDEILTYCNYDKPVKRVLISDLNLEPVKKAIANLQPNEKFANWSLSALARAIGDRLWGFNMTQAYTLMARKIGYGGLLSIGRVQTVLFGMINERTLANQNHKGSYFYNINATLDFNGSVTKAKFNPTDANNINDAGHLIDATEAKNISEEIKGKSVTVTGVSNSNAKANAPRPFSLSALQQICAKRYRYSATRTLEIMQSLYEVHKVVTYPRSDNRFLSDEHYSQREQMMKVIAQSLPDLANSIDVADLSLKHNAFNTSKIEAHHAIIPTLKGTASLNLNKDEMNVYRLVCESFIALFYPESVRAKSSVVFTINSEEGYTFHANQTVLIKAGWEVFYKQDIQEEKPVEGLDLSKLQKGSVLAVKGSDVDKRKTQPPKYHVESTLLASMSKAGKLIKDPVLRKQFEAKDKGDRDNCGSIGTEATKAAILETVKSRDDLIELVELKGYSQPVWRTTKQGQEFCALLPKEFLAPDISAIWSQQQQAIANGELTIESFIADLDQFVDKHVSYVKSNGVRMTVHTFKCPKCPDGLLMRIRGSKGWFWGCNCEGCNTTFPDRGNKPDLTKTQVKPSGFKCPVCESDLFRKPAKTAKGAAQRYFYSCSDYPNCKASYPEKNREPVF